MPKEEKNDGPINLTKRCPECFNYVSLETKKCPKCKTRLGKVEKFGMAKRTVDWTAYVIALVAIVGFGLYIWWAFLREQADLTGPDEPAWNISLLPGYLNRCGSWG